MIEIKQALAPIATFTRGSLERINNFPSYTILDIATKYEHKGDTVILKRTNFTIRGFTYTDEDSIMHTEALIRQIETALASIKLLKVLAVSTDEGFLKPYGICDIVCEKISYEC